MKKLFVILVLSFAVLCVYAQPKYTLPEKGKDNGKDLPVVKLPEPTKKGGMPLYDALMNRQTNRTFSDKKLKAQQISNLLWCANGVNREDGKRTAPSARNAQEITIYVLNKEGVFYYDALNNSLVCVEKKDLRSEMSVRGTMITDAPLTLLYVADYDKMKLFDDQSRDFYSATDAGFVSQNVYLYCAANGLNTVVMGAINRERIAELLHLKGKVILAQPVGYPVKKESEKQ